MRAPNYPSSREVDEGEYVTAERWEDPLRMKPSRNTWTCVRPLGKGISNKIGG